MPNWNPSHYLAYAEERTRAAIDLAVRVKLDAPKIIVDLGCGPGNSTQVLHQRWSTSEILGIDNSSEMIATARKSYPNQSWQLANVSTWSPTQPVDLAYSNAVLQWIPDHRSLINRLFANVAHSGALAFQIPSSTYSTVRTLIHEISRMPEWTEQMEAPRNVLTMMDPSFYYDILVSDASNLDIWETEYNHVMESCDAIVDWIASTGLRPFLAALNSEEQRNRFVNMLNQRVRESYKPRVDGKVLFPFRRTFVIAYR